MKLEFEPVKNQRFEIGRTINPFLCDCEHCDFMNCPKHNYAVKMRRKRHTVEEYINYYADDLKRMGFLTDELLDDFMDLFSFPKGTYWRRSYDNTKIEIVTFNRIGDEVVKGNINARTGSIWEYDFSKPQYGLACRISKGITKIYEFIEREFYKGDKQ